MLEGCNEIVVKGFCVSELEGFNVSEFRGYNRIVIECFYIIEVKGYSGNLVYDCKRGGAYLHHPVDVDEIEYPRLTNEGILFHHIKLRNNVIIYIYVILSFNIMIVVTRYHSRIMIVKLYYDTIIVDMYEPSNGDEVDVEFYYYIV